MESPAAAAARQAARDGYVVRPYEAGDQPEISRLFAESFPHAHRAEAHWRWKYHENPWGGPYVSLAVSPEGELAAHYAGYPTPFWCHGREFLGLQMGDTMTSPAHRHVGRGTSSLLARSVAHFFDCHRNGHLGFFYGFNTGAIQRFCRWFIGGFQAEAVGYRVRELDPAPAWSGRGYRVERVETFTDKEGGTVFDRLFRRIADRYGFLVKRDARYLDWRYLRCPDTDYVVFSAHRFGRLVGWSVFRRHDDRLLWGDAFFHPRHTRAAEPILARALETPGLAGARSVAGWFTDRPAFWTTELDRLGFESRPEPEKLALMILPDGVQEPPLGELYYTMGDGDLF